MPGFRALANPSNVTKRLGMRAQELGGHQDWHRAAETHDHPGRHRLGVPAMLPSGWARAQGSSVVTKIGIVLQKPTIIPDVIGSGFLLTPAMSPSGWARAQGSSVVTKIGIVLQKPTIIPDVIGSALTTSSNFFINYVAIQVSPPSVTVMTRTCMRQSYF